MAYDIDVLNEYRVLIRRQTLRDWFGMLADAARLVAHGSLELGFCYLRFATLRFARGDAHCATGLYVGPYQILWRPFVGWR